MNNPPYWPNPNDPNDPHSQDTVAGQYPTFPQPNQPSQYPPFGQQAPPPPQFPSSPGQYSQSGPNFPQYPQPGQFGPPPQASQKLSLWRRFRNKRKRFQFGVGCATLFVVFFLCTGTLAAIGSTMPNPPAAVQPSPTQTQHQIVHAEPPKLTPTPVPTATPAPTPSPTPTPQPPHYPPQTVADLHALAAKGDESAIYGFHSESVGEAGVCPQPKKEVTVDLSITGQQLAEDLLAYFYGQQLDSPCGSIVFAYHDQSEVNDPNTGGTYTAGMINFDVTDTNGSVNIDPNASNLKHKLTLDVGPFDTHQEYVVTY